MRLGLDHVLPYSQIALGDGAGIRDMAADDAGNVYVLGESMESSGLPVTTVLGRTSAPISWVMKLSSSREQIQYLTLLDFRAGTLTVDSSGNVYIGGQGMVAKLNPQGTATVWRMSFSSTTTIGALYVDSAGRVFLGGVTTGNGPAATPGAFQTTATNDNRSDGFAALLDANGRLSWLTYLAGTGWDGITSVIPGPDGSVFVGGSTTLSDFPTTTGAYERGRTLGPDIGVAFVARLSADGRRLIFSTFLTSAESSHSPHMWAKRRWQRSGVIFDFVPKPALASDRRRVRHYV